MEIISEADQSESLEGPETIKNTGEVMAAELQVGQYIEHEGRFYRLIDSRSRMRICIREIFFDVLDLENKETTILKYDQHHLVKQAIPVRREFLMINITEASAVACEAEGEILHDICLSEELENWHTDLRAAFEGGEKVVILFDLIGEMKRLVGFRIEKY